MGSPGAVSFLRGPPPAFFSCAACRRRGRFFPFLPSSLCLSLPVPLLCSRGPGRERRIRGRDPDGQRASCRVVSCRVVSCRVVSCRVVSRVSLVLVPPLLPSSRLSLSCTPSCRVACRRVASCLVARPVVSSVVSLSPQPTWARSRPGAPARATWRPACAPGVEGRSTPVTTVTAGSRAARWREDDELVALWFLTCAGQ